MVPPYTLYSSRCDPKCDLLYETFFPPHMFMHEVAGMNARHAPGVKAPSLCASTSLLTAHLRCHTVPTLRYNCRPKCKLPGSRWKIPVQLHDTGVRRGGFTPET